MPTLHHKIVGAAARWHTIASGDEWEETAHRLCQEAIGSGRDAVVLVEYDGAVREMLLTTNDDPDAAPWWSHRVVRPSSVAVAKRDPFALELVDVVGNFEAKS